MADIIPASIYLTNSTLVNGSNPVGRIQGTQYSRFALDPSLEAYGFQLPVVTSPLNDPTISYARLIGGFQSNNRVFSSAVTSLYERQSNYQDTAQSRILDVVG